MGHHATLEWRIGEVGTLPFRYRNDEDVPNDITGFEFAARFYGDGWSEVAVVTITDAENGLFIVTVTQAIAEAFQRGFLQYLEINYNTGAGLSPLFDAPEPIRGVP